MPKDSTNKSVSSGDDPRRAAGQKIRMMILGSFPNIGHFVREKNISDTDAKALSRIFSGRKQVNMHFAEILADEFGEGVDHWLALEHKILANTPQSVKGCQPLESKQQKGVEAMGETDDSSAKVGDHKIMHEDVPLRVSFKGATVEYPSNTAPEELARFIRALVDDGPQL